MFGETVGGSTEVYEVNKPREVFLSWAAHDLLMLMDWGWGKTIYPENYIKETSGDVCK